MLGSAPKKSQMLAKRTCSCGAVKLFLTRLTLVSNSLGNAVQGFTYVLMLPALYNLFTDFGSLVAMLR